MEALQYFTLMPRDRDSLQRQIPRLIEQSKNQWHQQVDEKTYIKTLPDDKHFARYNHEVTAVVKTLRPCNQDELHVVERDTVTQIETESLR